MQSLCVCVSDSEYTAVCVCVYVLMNSHAVQTDGVVIMTQTDRQLPVSYQSNRPSL